jgi:cysteine desulfurase
LTVGFAKATELAVMERAQEAERLLFLQKRFLNHIQSHLEDTYVNGDIHARIPGNLNISFFGVEGEGLMMAIKDLAVSSGSACTSASLEPSYVLRALGVGEELAHTSLRIGFGRFTTEAEVDQAALQIVTAVNRLRDMSPLWEMHKEGIDLSAVQWSGH